MNWIELGWFELGWIDFDLIKLYSICLNYYKRNLNELNWSKIG